MFSVVLFVKGLAEATRGVETLKMAVFVM